MMKFSSRSVNTDSSTSYESSVSHQSRVVPGVRFSVVRMSFARRTELYRRIRELAARLPFLESSNDFQERVEANLLAQDIEDLYIRWGLIRIDNLKIDAEAATTETLIERGPEELAREIVEAIKAECGLTEEERKN